MEAKKQREKEEERAEKDREEAENGGERGLKRRRNLRMCIPLFVLSLFVICLCISFGLRIRHRYWVKFTAALLGNVAVFRMVVSILWIRVTLEYWK